MGFMDKILNSMKLNDDDYDDDFYDDDNFYDDEPKSHKKFGKKEEDVVINTKPAKNNKQVSKITPMRQGKKSGVSMEVRIVKPTTIEDAR